MVAVLPALRVLQIQEDALRPRPTPYFDLTSRYDLVQLRVKNIGAGVAYDIRLDWESCPRNHKGEDIHILDSISVLIPQQSVSTLVGTSQDSVKAISDRRFAGVCNYKDASGKKLSHDFICSVDGSARQLTFDEELPRTLHDLQKIPTELARIAELLSELAEKEKAAEG